MNPLHHLRKTHVWKYLRNRTYRERHRELERLRSIPPDQAGKSNLPGSEVLFDEAATFLSLLDEIFDRESYWFSCDNPEPRILDCGANIGLAALYWKRLYPKSRITCFEPDPKLFDLLNVNLNLSGAQNVEAVQAAVWKDDEGVIFDCRGAARGHIAEPQGAVSVTAPMRVTSRSLLPFLSESVDMLKIDIEGAEMEVMRSIRGNLQAVRTLIVEYHSFIGRPQELAELLEIIRDAGFRYIVESSLIRARPLGEQSNWDGMDMAVTIFCSRSWV